MSAREVGLIVCAASGTQRKDAFGVREAVFVREQSVPAALERDEHDEHASHLLALWDGRPVGAARVRLTALGHKLERVAVLSDARGRGVGRALVEHALGLLPAGAPVYLHAQERALGFWTRLGFVAGSEAFDEAGIAHRKMVLVEALRSA